MDNEVVISLKNVSKYYKLYSEPKDRLKEALSIKNKKYHTKFYATNKLNLEIKKGEILGIVGQNGSGKSTLLKLITSVLKPDEGSIKVKGKISALLELGSGFNPEFTGLQNIFFYGTILGFTKKEMQEKLDSIIKFSELGDFINQPIKTYSSGMKSRLGFSVAIHVNPDILILDEVLSVGDIHFKRKSYAKMQEFFESAKTIIYVSHSSGEVNRLCTRAIMLHEGKIILDGEPKEVTKFYEKYLFAKDENKQKIINESASICKKEISVSKEKPKKEIKDTHSIKPYYIEDFISKNRVEYDNTYLKIENIHLRTMENEKVNVLVHNERYKYCYTLHFLKDFGNVDFGMQIFNEKGVLISGSKNEKSLFFEANTKTEVVWEFDCLMHSGVYYMSIGVNYLIDGDREYINRIVDAEIFKVIVPKKATNGIVSLRQSEPILIRK